MVKVHIEAQPNLMSNEYDIENNCVKYSNNITIQRAKDSNIKLSYSESNRIVNNIIAY